MKTEILEVDERFGKEFAGKYTFSELSKYHPVTGQVVSSDFIAIQAETIWVSLKEQPQTSPLTLERLLSETENGVPIALGELLSKVVNKLNVVSLEETKNS